MVTDDQRDVSVRFDLGKDSFSNFRMSFHLAPLVEGETSLFVEHRWRESDLSDVVDEACDVRALLLLQR